MTITSLLDREDVLVLDVETTGFALWSEIVDIAIIDTTGQVLIDSLVMPRGSVPDGAAAVHGLTDSRLREMKAPAWTDVFPVVERTLAKANVLAIYNRPYDLRLLTQTNRTWRTSFDLDFSIPDSCCVMQAYAEFRGERRGRRSDSTLKDHTLENAYRHETGKEPVNSHRALTDCRLTLAVMRAMAKSGADVPSVSLHSEFQYDGAARLDDKRIVITGSMADASRCTVERLIKRLGGRPTQSVSRKTDFVIVGDKPGKKLHKARELGIPVVRWEVFKEYLHNH